MKKNNLTKALAQAKELVDDKKFNELLHEVVEQDRSYLSQEEETDFMPQLMVFGSKDETGKMPLTIIGLPGLDEDNKQDALMTAGSTFCEKGLYSPVAIFMSSEAWMGSLQPKDGDDEPIMPSEDPQRQEVIVTSGLTVDKRTNMAVTKITRVGEAGIISLGTTQYHEYNGKPNIDVRLLSLFFVGYALAMTKKNSAN